MGRSINNKHSQDLCVYLLRCYEVLYKNLSNCSRKWANNDVFENHKPVSNREIYLKTLTF